MAAPSIHWLSTRIRVLCIATFVVGCLLPPYIPSEAIGSGEAAPELADASQLLMVEDGFLMKTSPLTRHEQHRTLSQGTVVTVQPGETIVDIAKRAKIDQETIRFANRLGPDDNIQAGMELLLLPVDGVLHTVTRGQTLPRIAELYGVDANAIAEQNNIQNGFITAGQQLIIPGGQPIFGRSTELAGVPSITLPSQAGSSSSRPPAAKPSTKPAQDFTANPTAGLLQWPCESCTITQYFHEGHYALDIAESGGGNIFAAEDGTVTEAENDGGWHGGYGNVVQIDHGNGKTTLYAHNKEVYIKVGDSVKRGQVIAYMGNTGRVYGVTGIHVHFEVRDNGVKRNPLLYLQ
ncbi:MAG: peptidoglycan DD-metalloendopeptidase family protein [Candidatus Peribacteraceae bacterium]|nr:peptidoglycan DD-metalloendopeptidase family protein [Candidatus Peribacteraceae bacterium]